MTRIRPCRLEDAEAVGDLHRRVFRDAGPQPLHGAADPATYYRTLLFENPWVDEELPSLALTDADDVIVGLLGVMPRPMRFRGTPIRCAVSTALMIDPTLHDPGAALRLLKAFIDGAQDLSWTDGATDTTAKLWKAVGGSIVPALSVKWARVFKPSRLALMHRTSTGSSVARRVASAACRPLDAAVARLSPFRVDASGLETRPLALGELTEWIGKIGASKQLCPSYDEETIGWLMDFLLRYRHRGELMAEAIMRPGGRVAGWSIRYSNPGRIDELLQLGVLAGTAEEVLKAVFESASRRGAAAIQGRVEAWYLSELWNLHCFGKRGSWALLHSKSPEISHAVLSGEAFLSELDGELWMPYRRESGPPGSFDSENDRGVVARRRAGADPTRQQG